MQKKRKEKKKERKGGGKNRKEKKKKQERNGDQSVEIDSAVVPNYVLRPKSIKEKRKAKEGKRRQKADYG